MEEEDEHPLMTTREEIEEIVREVVTSCLSPQTRHFKTLERAFRGFHTPFAQNMKALREEVEIYSKKTESLEEGLMYVLHNIKKNQFLYANYPDEWVKEYADIKKGIQAENKFMDDKIRERESDED